jgi:MFS family permease
LSNVFFAVKQKAVPVVDARTHVAVWRSVRTMPEFGRLLAVRIFSQFGDGLFQAALAGALLFNPDRAAEPWAVAASFAVLFLPYSVLGPFAGALLDRWDRRYVLVGASFVRMVVIAGVGVLLAVGAGDLSLLCGALIVNGSTRFVMSGLSAALPHVVPREQVVTMNSVATAFGAVATFLGANFMLVPRLIFGAGDTASATVIFIVTIPVLIAMLLALRFPPRSLGPDDTARAIHGSALYAVATGWLHGLRTVNGTPSVAATLAGLAAQRIAFGINTLLLLVIVRHGDSHAVAVAGLGTAVVFVAATGTGSFLANVLTPATVRRLGRFATANWALLLAAAVQAVGTSLLLPVMLVCGFLLGAAGQVIKLCADTAMQMDVDDPLRGHVFAVQDSLFWATFIAAIAVAAAAIPPDGHSPGLALAGAAVYVVGLAVHTVVGRLGPPGARG